MMQHPHTTARRHTVPRVVYRYLSGRPLSGVARTDATYLHPGTGPVAPFRRASRWAHRPGWQRQVVRVGTPLGAAGLAAGYLADPTLTGAGAGTVAATLAARAARSARRRWRTRRFRATYTRPLAAAIGPVLGYPEHTRPESWLTISPELAGLAARLAVPMSPAELAARRWYAEHIAPVVGYLPERATRLRWWLLGQAEPVTRRLAYFRRPTVAKPPRVEVALRGYVTPEVQKLIRQAVTAKLPLGDLIESWDQVGAGGVAVWTVRERPPRSVDLAAVVDALAACRDHEFLLGLAAGRRPVVVSLDDDSPHIACSAGSGAGKSVLAMLVAVQVLARGGRVTILDRKGSHRWALSLPGVTYCTAPADMHAALIGLADLADRRNGEALAAPDGWDPGPRHLIIFEEMNATVAQLKNYWEETREKSDPKTSPAIQGFRNIMYMGRSAKVHLFGVAQMLTAQTTGGPESRENFGIRCLARYTANNWKMLAPECAMPRKSGVRGRWQIVVAGTATECQVAYLTAAEARSLALAGRPAGAVVPESPVSADTGPGLAGPRSVPGQRTPTGDAPADPLAEPVTLREAVARGILAGSRDAVKKRLQRSRAADSEHTPAPIGRQGLADLYRVGDLIEWAEREKVRGEFAK
jgi:hypothetical protein